MNVTQIEDLQKLSEISRRKVPVRREEAIRVPNDLADALKALPGLFEPFEKDMVQQGTDESYSELGKTLTKKIAERWLGSSSKLVRFFNKKMKIYSSESMAVILIRAYKELQDLNKVDLILEEPLEAHAE